MHLRTRRLALAAGAGALLLGAVAAPVRPAFAATGSSPSHADPYAPAYGHPYRHGAVPTTSQSTKMSSFERAQTATAASNSSATLSYGGGIDGIGVTSGVPKVYLVFWGSQWGIQGTAANGDLTFSHDPDGGAPYLQEMFKGLGTNGETWSGVMTQFCDGPGVSSGATTCATNAAHVGYPKGGALAGVWYDSAAPEPSTATAHQIAQEAVSAAGHFGNTTAASNRYAQYIILSPTGLNPDNYQSPSTGFCGWHDYNADNTLDGGGAVFSPYGDVAFTNLPYLMDLHAVCGQGTVNNPGTLDGYSIVAGHEYSETITDQNPPGGWSNNNTQSTNYGAENADECAWITGGPGAMRDITFATGSFAMQSTWSNSDNGCAISGPIVLNDVIAAASGSSQNATVGTAYTNPLVAKVTDPYGTPIQGANVTFTAPSSGARANFGSPCSGTTCVVATDASGYATSPPLTAGSKSGAFTVTASDPKTDTAATFSLTNLASVASQMNIVSGTPQSVAVGAPYAPFRVVVADSNGNGVAGVTVTFTAPSSGAGLTFGSCSLGDQPDTCTVTSDSQGFATSSTPTANSGLGSFSVTASSSGLPPQSFSLTNVTGPASVIVVDGGSGQSALAGGSRFASPLTVTVTDQFGHPVANAPVTFSAPSSGPTGTFAPCSGGNPSPFQCVASTDTSGVATSSAITTASSPGTFAVTASVPGATSAHATLADLQSGYFLVGSDGGIFTYGGAPFAGSTGGMTLNRPIVGMATAPSGGYYLVASDGGIFNFGAPYLGSTGGMHLNAPIVGMAVAPGGGYYLVASDGGIFNFGNAPYLGSTGAIHLNKPIVGMAVAPGGGYYLVASDGGIFNFGAPYLGSTGGMQLNKPIVGMAVDPATGGYWLVASDGGIFNFAAPFYGSRGGSALNEPMVGMAASAVLPG